MNKLKVIQLLPELNIGGVERGTKDFSSALVQRVMNLLLSQMEEYLNMILLKMARGT